LNTKTGSETDIPCSRILITAGPWSGQVYDTLFPTAIKLPISLYPSISLTVRSLTYTEEHKGKGCQAIFTENRDGLSPMVFSRLGGVTCISGSKLKEGDDDVFFPSELSKQRSKDPALAELCMRGVIPSIESDLLQNEIADVQLPGLPTDGEIDYDFMNVLKATASRIIGGLCGKGEGGVDDLWVEGVNMGYCPMTTKKRPILGRIPDFYHGGITTKIGGEGGVWLATGHGAWGVSLSLGSGNVMAEMMQGKPLSVEIEGFWV